MQFHWTIGQGFKARHGSEDVDVLHVSRATATVKERGVQREVPLHCLQTRHCGGIPLSRFTFVAHSPFGADAVPVLLH